jgi:hypothetical protein
VEHVFPSAQRIQRPSVTASSAKMRHALQIAVLQEALPKAGRSDPQTASFRSHGCIHDYNLHRHRCACIIQVSKKGPRLSGSSKAKDRCVPLNPNPNPKYSLSSPPKTLKRETSSPSHKQPSVSHQSHHNPVQLNSKPDRGAESLG